MTPEGWVASLRRLVSVLATLSFAVLVTMLSIVVLHAYSPNDFSPYVLAPMMYVLGGLSGLALVFGIVFVFARYPQHRRMLFLLLLITAAVFSAHMYTIGLPSTADCHDKTKNVDGCIMDEVYYVPAAQALFLGEKCAPYADNCNLEHPFLSKAFIAAGIAIFGNNVVGWRFFQVLLGTSSIPVLFGICWSVTRNQRLSLYAAFLLGFETLFFVHSSMAVIDVESVFFGLLGYLFYFSRLRLWKLDSSLLAGLALGLSALSKETAIFLVLVLVLFDLVSRAGSLRDRVRSSAKIILAVGLVFIAGLQLYDTLFGTGAASNFLGHISFILSYGASLTVSPSLQACLFSFKPGMSGCGWVDSVLNSPITPLNWITYYSPIGYLITNVTENGPTGTISYIGAGYYGVTNQFEIWLTYLWAGYTAYLIRKSRIASALGEQEMTDLKLAKLALFWFLVVFVGYVLLFLYGRVTYPYYIIQAIPAVAIGCAFFLSRPWFPQLISYIVLAGVVLWFFIFYPDKSFLPVQLRALIDH